MSSPPRRPIVVTEDERRLFRHNEKLPENATLIVTANGLASKSSYSRKKPTNGLIRPRNDLGRDRRIYGTRNSSSAASFRHFSTESSPERIPQPKRSKGENANVQAKTTNVIDLDKDDADSPVSEKSFDALPSVIRRSINSVGRPVTGVTPIDQFGRSEFKTVDDKFNPRKRAKDRHDATSKPVSLRPSASAHASGQSRALVGSSPLSADTTDIKSQPGGRDRENSHMLDQHLGHIDSDQPPTALQSKAKNGEETKGSPRSSPLRTQPTEIISTIEPKFASSASHKHARTASRDPTFRFLTEHDDQQPARKRFKRDDKSSAYPRDVKISRSDNVDELQSGNTFDGTNSRSLSRMERVASAAGYAELSPGAKSSGVLHTAKDGRVSPDRLPRTNVQADVLVSTARNTENHYRKPPLKARRPRQSSAEPQPTVNGKRSDNPWRGTDDPLITEGAYGSMRTTRRAAATRTQLQAAASIAADGSVSGQNTHARSPEDAVAEHRLAERGDPPKSKQSKPDPIKRAPDGSHDMAATFVREADQKIDLLTGRPLPVWESPLVYPLTGPKKTTVEFGDITRLDDGEFLNDNLISFYLRYISEQFSHLESEVYFFNTYFYSTLTTTPRGGKGFNFEAVQKWTSKVDIFDYEFIVVPINEDIHWYAAIICNLTNIGKAHRLSTVQDNKDTPFVAPVLETADETGFRNQPPPDGLEGTFPSLSLNEQPARHSWISISGQCPARTDDSHERNNGVREVPRNNGTRSQLRHTTHSATSSSASNIGSDPVDGSVGSKTAGRSPSSKDRSVKSPRKHTGRSVIEEPIVIILDSLGFSHPATVRNLKQYLMAEGKAKRQIDVSVRELKGMTAKGIPLQSNYCDCGLFLLGYIEKFMMDPREFVGKVLRKEMDEERDWPDMNPKLMRNKIRDLLFQLEKEQRQEKREKRKRNGATKRAKYQAAREAAETRTEQALVKLTPPDSPDQQPPDRLPAQPLEPIGKAQSPLDRRPPPAERNSTPGPTAMEMHPNARARRERTAPSEHPSLGYDDFAKEVVRQAHGSDEPAELGAHRRAIDPDKHTRVAPECSTVEVGDGSAWADTVDGTSKSEDVASVSDVSSSAHTV